MQVSGTKNGKAPPFLYLISKIPLVVETFLAKLLTCGKQQNIDVFVQTVYRYA